MYKVDLQMGDRWYSQAIPSSAYGVRENGVNVAAHVAMYGMWNGGLVDPIVDVPLVLDMLLWLMDWLQDTDDHVASDVASTSGEAAGKG